MSNTVFPEPIRKGRGMQARLYESSIPVIDRISERLGDVPKSMIIHVALEKLEEILNAESEADNDQ